MVDTGDWLYSNPFNVGPYNMAYYNFSPSQFVIIVAFFQNFVKLRQGSGKDRQGMALKAKELNA